MKIKITLLLFAAFLIFINLRANPVDQVMAERVARSFLYHAYGNYGTARQFNDIKLVNPFVFEENGTNIFYAFDTEPGFIIISAEDGYEPVIGYSFTGSFEFYGAPEHYRGFIRNYAEQIKYIRDNGLQPGPDIRQAWTTLLSDDVMNAPASRDGRDVEPLLKHNWNQDSPYNYYCPADPAGPGGRTYVGCVATAMAQIMYYWRYPEVGTGQHCYTPSMTYGQQCANFGTTYYNWNGMNNGIDNKNPHANAELQYHCAVSVNMSFSPSGSGSYSSLVPGRLDSYFRYHDAEYLEKQYYSSTSWVNMLKSEIDLGRPVYYSGYNPTDGGHAFVCDGYQGDNFHFNFGWDGSGNGFYSLTNVGGFYQGQAMVRYFYPSETSYPYYNTGDVTITTRSGSITDGSGPVDGYLDNVSATWLIDPQTIQDSITDISLEFYEFDLAEGDTLRIYDGGTTSAPLIGAFSGATLPEEVTTTQNKMLITFTTDGSTNASGWAAEFSSSSPTWCSGLTDLEEPYGTFSDGSGDFYYQSGATCMWRINPDYAGKITLSFNYFETEAGIDKVKVFDGSTQIAEFSGDELPGPVEATSGSMFITWTTNQSNNMQGWEAYYEVDNVGIDEEPAVSKLQVYPNPAADLLNVSFETDRNEGIYISLISATGKVIYSRSITDTAGQHHLAIDISNFPSGVYMLRLVSSSGIQNKKIIVK